MQQRITAIMAIALFLFGFSALALAELPDPAKGFNDLQWGQQIAQQNGFKQIKAKGNAFFYVRDGEDFSLYGEQMPQVIYGAKGGKLFAAYVLLPQRTLFKKLSADLTSLYGAPKESTVNDIKIWSWKKDGFKIKLKDYPLTDRLKLSYYNETISDDSGEANVEAVMDKIYNQDLENYWVDNAASSQGTSN